MTVPAYNAFFNAMRIKVEMEQVDDLCCNNYIFTSFSDGKKAKWNSKNGNLYTCNKGNTTWKKVGSGLDGRKAMAQVLTELI